MLNPIKTKSNKLAVVADKSEIKNKVFDKIQDSLYKNVIYHKCDIIYNILAES